MPRNIGTVFSLRWFADPQVEILFEAAVHFTLRDDFQHCTRRKEEGNKE